MSTPKTTVVLACGHVAVVQHDHGDRLITCGYYYSDVWVCMVRSIVRARKVERLVYDVEPVQDTLPNMES